MGYGLKVILSYPAIPCALVNAIALMKYISHCRDPVQEMVTHSKVQWELIICCSCSWPHASHCARSLWSPHCYVLIEVVIQEMSSNSFYFPWWIKWKEEDNLQLQNQVALLSMRLQSQDKIVQLQEQGLSQVSLVWINIGDRVSWAWNL